MKLSSIQQIVHESLRTLRRFPFVLAVAAAGTVAAIVIVEYEATSESDAAFRVLFAALVGVAFLIGLALLAERRRWKQPVAMGLQAAGVVLLAAYALTLPAHLSSGPAIHVIRLLMLMTGMHLFVAVAPWLGRGEVNGFWQFNKTLFLRIFTAGLFTGVLFAGLAIALAAVENLFEVHVPGERYAQLWMLLLGMFNTWFFLAGIPEDLDALDAVDEYPKGLKIFAQYVLLPLVTVYFIILVAYTGKIVIAWSWPYGWVSRLILGFSVAGMFALLLLHPIREREGNRWILAASRWFYVVLAPLLVMYFLAVMRRLSDYGLTESRYLAIVIGVWLAAMVLYFLLSRGKNIKVIPLSLCVLAFLISVGPWGAFAVSENSQVHRLRAMLERNDLLVNEKLHAAREEAGNEDVREINAVLLYLHEFHGYAEIEPWFGASLRQDTVRMGSRWKSPADVAKLIGIEYVAGWYDPSGRKRVFSATEKEAMNITGYDRVLPERFFDSENPQRTETVGEVTYSLNRALDTLTFVLTPGREQADSLPAAAARTDARQVAPPVAPETLRVSLRPVIDTLTARYHDASVNDIPLELTAVEAAGARLKVKVYCLMLRFEKEEGRMKTANARLRVLYGQTAVGAPETMKGETHVRIR